MPAAIKKVPHIDAVFWILKILTTAMGEAISDYLVNKYDPVPVVLLAAVGFGVALTIQFAAKTYQPWKYWLTASMIAIFGTMVADVLHVGLGVPYIASFALFAVSLAAIFVIWQRTEKTLSIHSITTKRKELFYWLTVAATFALGTATGDLTAVTFHLGYLGSGIVFALLICLPLIAFTKYRFNAIAAFWIAYILTRPFGASFADWFGKAQNVGGLGVGSGVIGGVLLALIVAFVIYSTRRLQKHPSLYATAEQ